jgi:hypothetical protein
MARHGSRCGRDQGKKERHFLLRGITPPPRLAGGLAGCLRRPRPPPARAGTQVPAAQGTPPSAAPWEEKLYG